MSDLSICIPTYNRAPLLAQTLGHLLDDLRLAGLEDRIEVCVSDNGSSDATADVLRDVAARFPGFRHRRSDANQGFGPNLWRVVELASAPHVLLTGDDDRVRVERLPQILQAVAATAPDLLFLDSAPAMAPMAAVAGPCPIHGLSPYLAHLGAFHGTFIGNLLFKRSAFLAVGEGSFVAASAYPHMVPVLDCLARGSVFYESIAVTDPTDEHRPWRALQPIYTAIDLARVFADFGVTRLPSSASERLHLALMLGRSLPRAWSRVARGRARIDHDNPYQSISLGNVIDIYSRLLLQRRGAKRPAAHPDPAIGH